MEKFSDTVTDLLPSPDCRLRSMNSHLTGIIVHHTVVPDGYFEKSLLEKMKIHKSIVGWLTKKDDVYVSAHFQIGADGTVTQMVDPRTHVAYHAGVSEYFDPITRVLRKSLNDRTVGIELVGDGNEGPYTDAQYEALIKLSNDILKQFKTIDPRCVTGHENCSPGRKTDPGKYFDWRRYFAGLKFV